MRPDDEWEKGEWERLGFETEKEEFDLFVLQHWVDLIAKNWYKGFRTWDQRAAGFRLKKTWESLGHLIYCEILLMKQHTYRYSNILKWKKPLSESDSNIQKNFSDRISKFKNFFGYPIFQIKLNRIFESDSRIQIFLNNPNPTSLLLGMFKKWNRKIKKYAYLKFTESA